MIYRTALRLIGRSAWAVPSPGNDPLAAMTADVASRYPDIDHIAPAALAARLAATPSQITLFDVRTSQEFAISHLANAILVPRARAAQFTLITATLDQRPATNLVIFYCAVGVRSSALASLWHRQLNGHKATIANCAGGLFRWSNEGRPMVTADNTATTSVHPYNRHWQQFLRP